METVRQALQAELRACEKKVAQLRGKMARLEHKAPELLDTTVKKVYIHSHTRGISITLYDDEHNYPHLPTLLLDLSESDLVNKKSYDDASGMKMEYFSYIIAGITVDLNRKPKLMRKCRKARVERVIDICGEPGADVEVIEWLTD